MTLSHMLSRTLSFVIESISTEIHARSDFPGALVSHTRTHVFKGLRVRHVTQSCDNLHVNRFDSDVNDDFFHANLIEFFFFRL